MLLLSACSDAGLFSPNQEGPQARLALLPYFAVNGSGSAMADINLIRITVKLQPAGTIVKTEETTVDPTLSSWALDLEVPPNASLEILIELMNVTGNVRTVEYSGVVEVKTSTGPQPQPEPVPVVRGPPDNLNITGVTISPRNQDLLEGEEATLTANVTGPVTNPVVVWSSLSASVATVDNTGKVTARAPGQAVIAVVAGNKTDNITVNVGARATRIDVSPAAPTIASIGGDVTLTGVVRDVRNAEVPGLAITWSIADSDVAQMTAPGVFRGRRNGTTVVTATTVQRGRTITATVPLKVEQKAVSVSLNPGSASFTAIGATQSFTATAKDANGNDVSGIPFTWSSSDAAVATVDANGVATARGNGTAKIKVEAAGASAEANVTVQQQAASVDVTPTDATLTAIGNSVQLQATVKDARGNTMNLPVTWSAPQPHIVDVDASGKATARGDGPAVIIASSGTARGTATVTVERRPAGVKLNVDKVEINAGTSFQFRATVVDANGFGISPQPAVTYSSSNTNVVTVNSTTGQATGVSAGEAQIVARSGTLSGNAAVVVKGTSGGFHIANGRVLLYHIDDGIDADFKNRLVGTGVFTADKIDRMPMYGPLPSLATLSQYGCVLAWTDGAPSTPTGVQIGDRLKEYVDAGGKVVLAVYALGVPSRPWELQGGIMSPGYSPLVLTENEVSSDSHQLNMSTALTSHPIMQGVTSFNYFSNSNYTRATLAPGATLVGSDNHGDPIIAVSANGRVVAINVWPGFEYHGSTASKPFIDRAFANACR